MDCRKFREKLSEFLDRALPAPETARAEAHMAECRGCRSEFEELKGLSRMVSALPQQPLPVGFMQRLERRRAAEAAPPRYAFLPPGLPRAAAFALSGLVVMLVAYDRLKTTLPEPALSTASVNPTALPGLAPRALDSLEKAAVPAGVAGASRSALKQELTAKESAYGEGATTSTGVKLAKARGAPLESADAAATAPAAPQYTNEQIAADLEAQKRRMGIRRVVHQDSLPPGVLAALRGAGGGDAQLLQAEVGPANLGGDTPTLLAPQSAARGAAPARGEPVADQGRLDEAPGVLIHSEAERADLWHKYQIAAAPPQVDYASQMLAVVFGSASIGVAITSVSAEPDRIVISYHEVPVPAAAAERPSSAPPYQFRVIPKTDKPVVFERLP